MLKNELSLSEVIEFFKKNKVSTFDQDIDEFGGYFVTAATIAALVISPDAITKIAALTTGLGASSFKVSSLFSWIPDTFKYKNKGREIMAIQRYELSTYTNFVLSQLAIRNGVREVILPHLELIMQEIQLDDIQCSELKDHCAALDKERLELSVPVLQQISQEDISTHASKIVDPILQYLYKLVGKKKISNASIRKLDSTKVRDKFIETSISHYHGFLIHFSAEFPEFALWADLSFKNKIVKDLKASAKTMAVDQKKMQDQFVKKIEQLSKQIKDFRDGAFIEESGFPTFLQNYQKLFKVQQELFTSKKERILENINAHHAEIKKEVHKLLSDNKDVDGIVYPKNKDIYIAQSFEAINYKKKEHHKNFLTTTSLGNTAEKGENIGNYLLSCLSNPLYVQKPIVLLGNPGAGKSMLSKMFSALLCDTTDYIPFLIKLRTVASSSTSISEHINKGLANSIENNADINWLDWAKEFKDRMPIVIMDGFDELMQTSTRELNGYLENIREFQEKAISNNVCVRIILTSRITVMHDVTIPEGTKIIKLNSFDDKRRNLWITKWNDVQQKSNYTFSIPENEKILLLAREPLLMFMLAVYDFENSELQNMVNDLTFNQSRLYDSLLEKFISRQLEKDDRYKNTSKSNQILEDELFRLRLGMIALMMFLNDTTSRDSQKLKEEMLEFGIQGSSYQTDDILGGFFFIHENKSVTDTNVEKFNYEFLHKTFGEFLTADFMLRIASKQAKRFLEGSNETIAKKGTFQFAFGYNWLHKHHNILNFLFEHGKVIIKPGTSEYNLVVTSIIKQDLKEMFETMHHSFPVNDFRLMDNRPMIDHLSIYSQNLVFLWLAISEESNVEFNLFDRISKDFPNSQNSKYESQDRDEVDKNKWLWKRISGLWGLTGNHKAAARLKEWIQVREINDGIQLNRQVDEVSHNFSDAAEICCNDFEWILSYFDNECKLPTDTSFLERLTNILQRKPELKTLATDAILHRFLDLYSVFSKDAIAFIDTRDILPRQQVMYVKKIGQLRWHLDVAEFEQLFQFVVDQLINLSHDNPPASIEFVKILAEFDPLPLSMILSSEKLEDILHRMSSNLNYIDSENPVATFEYLNLINRFNKKLPLRRRYRVEFLDELFYKISRDFRKYIDRSPYMILSYMKVLGELKIYSPMNRKLNTDVFDELLRPLSFEYDHILKDNPYLTIQYLSLLNDLRVSLSIERKRFRNLIGNALENFSVRHLEDGIRNRHEFFEYVKVLSEIDQVISLKEIMSADQIHRVIYWIAEHIVIISREHPNDTLKYLRVLKQFRHILPLDDMSGGKILDVLMERLTSYLRRERKMGTSFLLYLELALVFSNNHTKQVLSVVEDIIERLVSSGSSIDVVFKTSGILLEYKMPTRLSEKLLSGHPALLSLLGQSPELTEKVIKAQFEITHFERID